MLGGVGGKPNIRITLRLATVKQLGEEYLGLGPISVELITFLKH